MNVGVKKNVLNLVTPIFAMQQIQRKGREHRVITIQRNDLSIAPSQVIFHYPDIHVGDQHLYPLRALAQHTGSAFPKIFLSKSTFPHDSYFYSAQPWKSASLLTKTG